MFSIIYRHPLIHQLISFRALLVLQVVTLLLLTDSCQSQDVGPSETIIALEGEDVILPCHLEPAADAASKSLEWGRPDLEPRFVHVWHEGQNHLVNQNPSYKGRTSLSVEKLRRGDLSLELSELKHSDNGMYRCYFPSQGKASTVQLLVGSVSSPVISAVTVNSSTVDSQCECKGWYPEPEVLWLDGEGNVLSAGPTETVRGPDDLYTVSSRVTVDKRHGNTFTCRVQQTNISQTRDTHIHVSAKCFPAPFCFDTRFIVVISVSLIFICAAVIVLGIWTQQQVKETEKRQRGEAEEREREKLLADEKKQDLEEKKAKLSKELKNKEEEEKNLDEVVKTLKELREELSTLKDQLKDQIKNMEKEQEETEKKVQSVDKETERDRAKGYFDLKDIILDTKRRLMQRRQEHDEREMQTRRLVNKTDAVIKKMTERKEEVERLKGEICLQLQTEEEGTRRQNK